MRSTAALALALALVSIPRVADAQDAAAAGGSEATGIGVGAQAFVSGIGDVPTAMGTIDVPALAGPSVVYQTPAFHIDGILTYQDIGDVTVFGAGGRFFYELHSTQASDLSVGGGLGLLNVDPGDESETLFTIEAGAKLRAFLAPSVALHVAAGLGVVSSDPIDYFVITGQLVGSFGITYFFF